jgi:hypothetical protein
MPGGWVIPHLPGGSERGRATLRESSSHVFLRLYLAVFRHMVFADGFLILVKELGLLTNLGQWIRGLDATRSYICIVL